MRILSNYIKVLIETTNAIVYFYILFTFNYVSNLINRLFIKL